jgi:excisionase family DNA binding protein
MEACTEQERLFIRGAARGRFFMTSIQNEVPTVNTDTQLMTVADVIAAMGVSRSTWQKLVSKGRTPPIVKIGAVQRIRREAFEAWLADNEVKTPAIHG